ncbi:ribonuclease HII [Caviibacter abscessus]|uniref:ribonuclease HII n=1 Tax=Caviibacter abscessus TaxID=1766719 RepID=UPI0009E7B6EC|nr:ribonuclease HII [Caviibacter abscessus]
MLEYKDNIGVDEAGRGPLLGCVVACCVYINKIDNEIFEMINDSKKLSESKRDFIYDKLKASDNISYGIGMASENEIDKINILNATFLAMNRALDNLYSKNKAIQGKLVIVDGNKLIKGYNGAQEYLVKGDSKNLSIALASIIAKVTRDKIMYEYDKIYPNYNIANHKGYGTKKHYEAIEKYGILPIHRKTFLKKFLNKD